MSDNTPNELNPTETDDASRNNESDSGDTDGLFWAGAPLTVRSELFHIYREETGRSLCGKYRHASLNAKQPVEEGDTWTDGGDCKACCRKADPVKVDNGGEGDA